jgi:outer membrane protein assembly complex protein YaeT
VSSTRTVLKWMGAVSLGVVLLVVLAIGGLHTPPGRRFVLSQVTGALAQQNILLDASQLRFNLLDLSIDVRDVVIRSGRSAADPPFAVIPHLTADLSLLDALRGRYVLESATADDARVHYLVDANGDNLPRPLSDPNQPEEPLDYLIADLRIMRAEVQYEDRVRQVTARVPVESLTIAGDRITGRHTVVFNVHDGQARVEDRDVRLDRFHADVSLGDDDVRLAEVVLEGEGAHAKVSGAVSQFDAPLLDLRASLTIDATRAARLARVEERIEGGVSLEVTATGAASAPVIDARMHGQNITFRSLSAGTIDAHVGYDGPSKRVTAHSLAADAPWARIRGTGQVSLEGGPSEARVTLDAVDIAPVMRGLNLATVVASRLDGQADVSWPGLDYLGATGTATMTLRPTRSRPSRSVLPVGGRLVARGDGRRVVADIHGLNAAGTLLNGQVAVVDRQRLQGSVRGTMTDAAATASAAEAFLGREPGAFLSDRISGAVVADASIGGTTMRPVAEANVDAPEFQVASAGTLALTSSVQYTPEMLTLKRVNVTWGGAAAHAAGRIGLEAGQPLDVVFDVTEMEVQKLLALAGQERRTVRGILSLQGTGKGTTADPLITATLRGTEIAAANEPIGDLTSELIWSGDEVRVAEFTVDKPQPGGNGRLTASGTYDLQRRAFSYRVDSTGLRLVGATLPDGRTISGGLIVEGEGGGPVEAPVGALHLVASDLRLDEHTLGTVSVDASAANAQATMTLLANDFGLQANATIDLAPAYPAVIEAKVENLDLARLPVQRSTPLEGRLSAAVTSTLELSRPRLARVNSTIEAFEGAWNGQPFALTGPAIVAFADEQIAIEQLTVTAQDSTVSVHGTLPLAADQESGDVAIDATANLGSLARYAPSSLELSASGTVQLTGHLRGSLEFIDPDLQLSFDDVAVTTPALGSGLTSLTARATLVDGAATLERLTGRWAQAHLEAAGVVPLDVAPELPVEIPRRGGAASFRAAVVGLDPATLPGAPENISGLISVQIEGSAERPELAALRAAFTFPDLRVAFRDLELAQQQRSSIRVENGVATIDTFNLTGSAGHLGATGSVRLSGARPLDVRIDGEFNTAVASSFTDAVRAEGMAALNVTAKGTVSDPDLAGTMTLADVNVVSDEPRVVAERLNARVELGNDRVTLTTLSGDVNGGKLTGSGGFAYRNGGIDDVNVQLSTTGFSFDAPLDLRSLSDVTVAVTEQGDDDLLVSGKVLIREAGLTGDVNFDTGLLATLDQPRALDLTEERNPWLERLNINVQVITGTPILVDNNLARAEIRTDLRVLGTPYETGMSGTLTVLEGGEITLNERRYAVERGTITFLEERRIVPSFDLRLNTSAGNYDVVLAVTGEPGDTETTLTADPALPEPDIMALLVTGRTLDEMRGEEGDVAKEQVLSYLAGRVGSQLGRGLEEATGLSDVRVEPNLIANEADPSARLTVAQELTDELRLVYSTDLTDSNDQIWVARYDVTRRFQTNAVRQPDSSYRLDFRHDVRFGGRPSPRRTARTPLVVSSVDVAVTGAGLNEAELRERIGYRAGDSFDYFKARDRVDDLQQLLQERGHLQARVRLDRSEADRSVALILRVEAGPLVKIAYEGARLPGKVDDEVRRQWNRGVFDSQRAGDATEAIREWLIAEQYLASEVTHRIDDASDGSRRVLFTIAPGVRFDRIELVFAGAAGIDPAELDSIVDEQDLELQLFTDPLVVTELLRRYYREEGYLSAELDAPAYAYEGNVARAIIQIREGPRFTVRKVAVKGNTVFDTGTLLAELPVVSGDPFLPRAAQAALERTREVYWRQAYNDVRSEYAIALDREAGAVDVEFAISEGPKSVIADLNVTGNEKTSKRLVDEQLEIREGQPLDLAALGRSRRNLYDTGAFSMVDITREAMATEAETKPVRLNVTLREVQPVQVRYGASYDTERGLGGILDVSNHNTLGKARVLGLAARYDGSVREGRVYLNQPSLRYWPVATTTSVYYREERNVETALTDPFNVDRYGLSVQQERELGNSYIWTSGYRYERARRLAVVPGAVAETTTVSPLMSTFTRETRDEVLDATRGSFTSHGFSYSPTWLGGDDAYVKYYGQYFHYIALQPERRKRFTNEILRPRLVFATGVRIGLGRGFGGRVPETERFYAGGSTTLRGFEQNSVGPVGPDGVPTGGEGLFVLNNELRFPLVGIVDGVTFLDIGNVFDRLSDFDVSDLRRAGGIGLRLRTPWFLLRGDYGVVLDRRQGEPRSRFYFSIGQAF